MPNCYSTVYFSVYMSGYPPIHMFIRSPISINPFLCVSLTPLSLYRPICVSAALLQMPSTSTSSIDKGGATVSEGRNRGGSATSTLTSGSGGASLIENNPSSPLHQLLLLLIDIIPTEPEVALVILRCIPDVKKQTKLTYSSEMSVNQVYAEVLSKV